MFSAVLCVSAVIDFTEHVTAETQRAAENTLIQHLLERVFVDDCHAE